MQEQKSDLELIEEFKKGNHGSFEELLQRYSDKAFNLSYRLTRNQQDAEEVLQDVFITVFRKIHGFEGKSSFSSWLYRVTLNAALMKLRRRKNDPLVSIDDVLPQALLNGSPRSADGQEGEKVSMRNQMLTVIQSAINKLPEDYRPVFILRDVDGLTSREVSKILNLSIPAVKSRLHRSRSMLRRRLSRYFRDYDREALDTGKRVENL